MADKILSVNSSLIIQAQNSNNSSSKILNVLQLLANQSVEEMKELKLLDKSYSYKHFGLTLAPAKMTDTFIQTFSKTEKDASVIIMDTGRTCKQNSKKLKFFFCPCFVFSITVQSCIVNIQSSLLTF